MAEGSAALGGNVTEEHDLVSASKAIRHLNIVAH